MKRFKKFIRFAVIYLSVVSSLIYLKVLMNYPLTKSPPEVLAKRDFLARHSHVLREEWID